MKKAPQSVAAVLSVFLMLHASLLFAVEPTLPQNGTVVAGSASMDYAGNTLNVNQSSQNVAINWDSFSIGEAYAVNFHQPGSDSVALNRVTGTDPSLIFGALHANGRIFIVNPNGVIFGQNSRVDVNGLIASTLDMRTDDFMAGRYNFYKVPGTDGYIINNGHIIANGGYVLLLSQAVSNADAGVIVARLGNVVLAGGAEKATVALDDLGQISVVIDEAVQNEMVGPDGKKLTDAVSNKGLIVADGGHVVLTAKVLNKVFDYAVNNSGVVEASSLVDHNGVIELLGIGDNANVANTGRLSADGTDENGDGGFIKLCAGDNLESLGILSAAATAGHKAGSAILDPAGDITLAGSIAADATAWTTGSITLTGDVTIDGNFTLNIFADHKSATAGDWDDGIGDIVNTGNFSIMNGAGATSTTLNLKSGNAIGTLANPVKTDVDNLSAETNPVNTGTVDVSQGARALNVTNVSTSGDVSVISAGNMRIGSISTLGAVTLSSGGAITNDGSPINVFATTLQADASSGISLHTYVNTLYTLVTTSGDIIVSNGTSMNAALAQAPGNVSVSTTAGDLTAGSIVAGAGMSANLSAAGAIKRDAGVLTNVSAGTLSADAASGIDLNTSVDNVFALVVTAGDINIFNDKSVTVSLAQAPGNVTVSTKSGDVTAGTITAGPGMVATLSAAGAIKRDAGVAVNVSGGTLSADAATGIDLNTSVDGLFCLNSGTGTISISNDKALQVSLAQSSGTGDVNITANGAVQAGSVTAANGNVNVTAQTGDVAVTNITSTTGKVSINVPNGSVTAVGAGPHIVSGSDVTLTVPKGTVSTNGSPLDTQITNGDLVLKVGGVSAGGVSADMTGSLAQGKAVMIDETTPGQVLFNGATLWPLPVPVASGSVTGFIAITQGSNEFASLFMMPTAQGLAGTQVNAVAPAGPVLFYHPLTEIDESAFDHFTLEKAAFEFIDGTLKAKGGQTALR